MRPQSKLETEGAMEGRRSWEHLQTRVEFCHYADPGHPLLEMNSWPPPGRSVPPKQAVLCEGQWWLCSSPLVSFPIVIGICFRPLLSPPFSFSLQSHFAAASTYQPSSPTPTSWLTLPL